jgi:tetratricopeptide (TPR) repeat protein
VADDAAQLGEEEFQQLYDRARMALHLARNDEALDLARKMLAARPDSTTAHEVMGDVLLTRNQLPEAEAEFRRASELEPANADAQRKLGEVVLRRSEPEFQRRMLQADLEDHSHRGMHKPDPKAAALRSGLFPGFGQLYNGDFERGAAVAFAAMVLLGVTLTGLLGAFPGILSGFFPGKVSVGEPSPYNWPEIILGSLGYTILYVYSIWEATQAAREHARSGRLYNLPPQK